MWRSQGSVVQMRLEQCMRNLVHTKADKEMQLYILQKDFQFDIKQKMSLILLEQGMYTEQQNDGKFRAMTVKNVCMSMVDSQNMMTVRLRLSVLKRMMTTAVWNRLKNCRMY